jgi:hypothetical protein
VLVAVSTPTVARIIILHSDSFPFSQPVIASELCWQGDKILFQPTLSNWALLRCRQQKRPCPKRRKTQITLPNATKISERIKRSSEAADARRQRPQSSKGTTIGKYNSNVWCHFLDQSATHRLACNRPNRPYQKPSMA